MLEHERAVLVDADPAKLFSLVEKAFGQRRKMLRRSLAGVVDAETFARARVRPEARAELLDAGGSTLGADWRTALDSGMLDLVRAGRIDEARELLQASLPPADPPSPGSAS